ncbi:hypothetical protein Catovirus_1_198 [Catovirus CTV1]|uniref:Uncharacterized protein n=1 Tax=Catovirus CTV1 TaxID=1977631 RepID=A0A1V0S929_9VIRU|nr:hypothetical protein Catovirus_1_198 [Catovirus CTV1]
MNSVIVNYAGFYDFDIFGFLKYENHFDTNITNINDFVNDFLKSLVNNSHKYFKLFLKDIPKTFFDSWQRFISNKFISKKSDITFNVPYSGEFNIISKIEYKIKVSDDSISLFVNFWHYKLVINSRKMYYLSPSLFDFNDTKVLFINSLRYDDDKKKSFLDCWPTYNCNLVGYLLNSYYKQIKTYNDYFDNRECCELEKIIQNTITPYDKSVIPRTNINDDYAEIYFDPPKNHYKWSLKNPPRLRIHISCKPIFIKNNRDYMKKNLNTLQNISIITYD